jgi:7,8-dihydropterin-6-yl-methyl-4-(beta-D-ribofuranosyl)aminobenzene 5'-phosphate synthase
MVEKAKEIFPGLSFDLVLGGFHLRDQSLESVNSVVLALMNMGVLRVAPTHCSGKNAQIIFQQHFGERYLSVGAGMQLEI